MEPKIGFIGQGYIGKNYADDFEKRGYSIVRYALDAEYVDNKDKIRGCDIVFIAVPTPTTPSGFDDSIVRKVVALVGKGKIAVIKSTLLPGTTKSIQSEYPEVFVVHSPEFLTEKNAKSDASHPKRNIVGITEMSESLKSKASEVIKVLPKAEFELVCDSSEAELIKYAGNNLLFLKTVFINVFYDVSEKLGLNWEVVSQAIGADSRLGKSHLNPVFGGGRGAGGNCFIKDFSAFADFASKKLEDKNTEEMLGAIERKNIDLLVSTGKDIPLLNGVYGKDFIDSYTKSR